MTMDPVRAATPIALQLRVISGWLAAVVNRVELEGRTITPEVAQWVLIRVIARADQITFGMVAALDGSRIVSKLYDHALKIEVPESLARVLEGFARTWTPESPHCKRCELPGLTANANLTGVDSLTEGTLCPWCDDGESYLVSRPYFSEILHWVTGLWVPDTVGIDTTTIKGAEIPVSEAELRKATVTTATLLRELDAQEVKVGGFLYYLMQQGAKEFGLQAVSAELLLALRTEGRFTKHGPAYLQARVLEAKRLMAEVLEAKRLGKTKATSAAQPGAETRPASPATPTNVLSGPDQVELGDLVGKLYPSYGQLQRLLRSIGLDPGREKMDIGSSDASINGFNAVENVRKQPGDKLGALLARMQNDHPLNAKVKKFTVQVSGGSTTPPGRAWLSPDRILEVCGALGTSRLSGSMGNLLNGSSQDTLDALDNPTAPSNVQETLNRLNALEGIRPLEIFLINAVNLARDRPELQTFQRALDELRARR